MKRARKGKAATPAEQQLAGAEALRLKSIINRGGQPDLPTLLRLLNSGAPCAGLYSKDCKVRPATGAQMAKTEYAALQVRDLRLSWRTAGRRRCRPACGAARLPSLSTPLQAKGGNANCLCNLIPAPDKTRKAGLWARRPGSLAELGPDPATLKREVGPARNPLAPKHPARPPSLSCCC